MDQLKVTVEIRAETLLARDFLETNLHVLKADLQQSGLEIDKIDVLVDPDQNSQQEQGRTSAHKQTQRMNGQLKEENTLADADPKEARQVISSGREENQIDCFV
jgi:flagellar hook-length control protein FliK